ncbi:MAG: DUF4157 domain-containing protein [Myxococcales bacterium]|nr:DUF4157 domain-containing protein [Myxococcales bacterium]
MVITDDGHLRVEAGADLLRRVRRLPEGNAAREPLLRLFLTVDTDLRTGERSVSGGASLELQFDRDSDDHDGPGELHQLARTGTSGGGASLPHLAQIQAAFGHHDVSGVRAHVGGAATAATGAMGARGYAYGDDVAFASAPDLRLAAHEAAHVVQQRGGVRLSGGVGSAGDEYERHADAVAELVVRGESAQTLLDERAHRGAAGGPAIQRDLEDDRRWLASLGRDAEGHYTHMDGTPLTGPERRRLRRVLNERDGGAARRAPTDRPEGVERHERLETEHVEGEIPRTELDEDRERDADETGTSRRPGRRHGGDHDSATGGRIRTTETLEDGTTARVDRIRETRRHDHHGERVERRERGRRAEALHGPTLVVDVHDRLVAELATLDGAERRATSVEELRRIRSRRTRLREDIATLSEPDVSRERATAIAERHDITVLAEEDVSTTTTVRDANPLDGSVGRSTHEERSVRELDGSGSSSSDRRSTRLDLGEGAIESTHDTEESETDAEGTTRATRTSSSHRGSIGGGRAEYGRRSRVESERPEGEGGHTARETSSSAGAIVTEDETGIRFGATDRTERTADGVTSASESSAAAEITDRRVGLSASRGGEIRDGATRGTARVSADGSFSIDVEPIEDGSGRFRMTFTIHLGAGGTLGASHDAGSGDRARSSISGRASASSDLISSRVISEADAQRYLDAADRAERGEEVSDPPEFGRLARLRAAGGEADALLQSGAVFGDSNAASAMADGDSITLDMEVGVGGDIALGGTRGGFGADVGAGGDARWRRTVQVERITVNGLPRVRLTVTYHDETEAHVEASAALAEVGAARGRLEREAGATDSVQFVIDPAADDYDSRYHAIVGTTDRTQLRALEREYAEDVRRSRHADTGATESEYELGPTSSLMVGAHSRTTHSDDVTTVMDGDGNATGLEADISGGTDSDLRVRAGGHDVDVIGHSESAHGTVDADHGARVDIEAREEHIDPLAAASDGIDALAEADGARDRAALVLAHTPAEHLQNAFRQFSHTWGYHLGEHDLEVMSERARDTRNWGGCCIVADADVLGAWRALRGALAHPRPDAAEARVDEAAAINIARIRALSTWMQHADGHGAECIEHVLRRWGESMTHEVDAERLGVGYEWPVELRDTHTRYDGLVSQCEGIRDRFEAALARPAGNTEARSHFNSVKAGLERVLSEIRASTDFVSESRRSELIREVEQHRADVFVRFRDFERRWAELHTECGGEVPTDAEIDATRASGADITAERSRAYVRAGIRVLQGNHTRETEMLQRVQAEMRDLPEDVLFGTGSTTEAASLCTQVHDLHRTWIQQVQDLRQAYSQAGTPEAEWQVSTGPGERRNRELEPNVGWLIIEYRRVMQHVPLADNYEDRIAQWREEGNDY